jgi:hypothetical protein
LVTFNTHLKAFGDSLFEKQSKLRICALLKKLLYAFVLIKCIYWLCYFDLFFGNFGMFTYKPHPSAGLHEAPFMLYNSKQEAVSLAVLIITMVLCCVNILTSRLHLLTDLLIWFSVLNIHNKTYGTLTGGDFLLNQLLFYNFFLSGRKVTRQDLWGDTRVLMHNAGLAAMIAQVCLVYLVSGIAKLVDPDWLSGRAITMIAGVEHFRTYVLAPDYRIEWIEQAINYFVLLYQVLFPVLIWFRKLKMPLLLAGVLMHLYIALGMGLVSFGAIMIVCYLLFLPDEVFVAGPGISASTSNNQRDTSEN